MKNTDLKEKLIIGIKIRTSNMDGASGQDIPQLWERFMTENTIRQIPNKLNEDIYCIYTNYETDHHGMYDTIIGCEVSTMDIIPKNMVSCIIEQGPFAQFEAKGNLTEGVVWDAWMNIWKQDLDRTYKTDFEIYGAHAIDPSNASLDIYVSL